MNCFSRASQQFVAVLLGMEGRFGSHRLIGAVGVKSLSYDETDGGQTDCVMEKLVAKLGHVRCND